MTTNTLTTAQKIAVLQERGDEHCRRAEAAYGINCPRTAAREKRLYLLAYSRRDLVQAGYDIPVRVRTQDEALAAACAKASE